jgi:hypothetical protein
VYHLNVWGFLLHFLRLPFTSPDLKTEVFNPWPDKIALLHDELTSSVEVEMRLDNIATARISVRNTLIGLSLLAGYAATMFLIGAAIAIIF